MEVNEKNCTNCKWLTILKIIMKATFMSVDMKYPHILMMNIFRNVVVPTTHPKPILILNTMNIC